MKFLLTFKQVTTRLADVVVEVQDNALNFTSHTDEEKRDHTYAVLKAMDLAELLKLAEGKWEVLKSVNDPHLAQLTVINDDERDADVILDRILPKWVGTRPTQPVSRRRLRAKRTKVKS